MSVEWRLRDGSDALLMLNPNESAVSAVSSPDERTLKSFLAATGTADAWQSWPAWRPLEAVDQDPDRWGELVLSRAESGEVISIDPELFWEQVHRRFRS